MSAHLCEVCSLDYFEELVRKLSYHIQISNLTTIIKRFVLLLVVISLSACASVERDIIGLGSDSLENTRLTGATVKRVFIATTRQRSDNPVEFFGGERSQQMHLGYMDVSIPKAHKSGRIERPKNSKVDPEKHFVLSKPTLVDGEIPFRNAINQELRTKVYNQRDVLLFVHGYNTNFSAAVLRIAQFVHDIDYKGTPVLFSWASRGQTLDYLYDLNSALQSRDELERLGVILTNIQATNFDIVAHSMGNLVTLEAMRKLDRRRDLKSPERLRHVLLASPDIDIDLFEAQLKDFRGFEDRFTVLVSDDDRALSLSRSLAGGVSRVGATDPVRLAKLGLKVIDLTAIKDKSSTKHTKFASSPDIVQLIGEGIQEGNTLSAQTPPSAVETLVGGVVKGIKIIPSSFVSGAQAAVISVAN